MADRHDQAQLTESDRSLVFRARALAQAHPFSPASHRYLNSVVARERLEQPQAEIGMWAGNGLTVGYCLRKLEEVEVAGEFSDVRSLSFDEADQAASELAASIRTSDGADHFMMSEPEVIETLDELISGEIERRLDHWKGTVSDETWAELEEYIAWWVVKGYALRIAETRHVRVTEDDQR